MLVLWDRGLHRYAMIHDTRERGAEFLGRVGKAVALNAEQILTDGTFLARVYPSPKARRQQQDGRLVRVIEYTIDDPARVGHEHRQRLITSLLAADRFPADAVALAYHERWEVESTADEVKTPQADRRPAPPVRSRRPREVVPQVYGLLLAHLAVRLTMAAAAAAAGVDPDELSFTGTLRILRRAVSQFQRGQQDPVRLPFAWTGCCARSP